MNFLETIGLNQVRNDQVRNEQVRSDRVKNDRGLEMVDSRLAEGN